MAFASCLVGWGQTKMWYTCVSLVDIPTDKATEKFDFFI